MGGGKILAIVGPTACGKTTRAVQAARALGGEIISADSRQIYRGMDLGTGKDLDEYASDGTLPAVPYHLIDIAPAGYKYNLYEYLRDYKVALAEVRSNGHLPIICGGTGLYVESVLNSLSLPEVPANESLRDSLKDKSLEQLTQILASKKTLHNTTDVDTAKRAIRAIEIAVYYEEHPDEAVNATPHPDPNAVVVGLDIPRELRRKRISRRLDQRLKGGMVDEVRSLIDSGVSADDLMYYGLEYKFITQYVIGELTYEQMHELLEIAIHQFAKRQMTWFRGMERRGFTIHWLPYDLPEPDFIHSINSLIT